MNQLIKMDEEYRKWIEDIGKRYKQRQIKASVSVNQEMIGFYWSIGRDIVEKSAESKWGSGFFVNLSKDMRTILPGVQGLSSSNLRYMKKFYELYSDPNSSTICGRIEEQRGFNKCSTTCGRFIG